MSQATITILVLIGFISILLGIAKIASRSNVATPKDFYLANGGLGTIVMAMTMGSAYFSTWTLLGAIGQYYRDGVWFIAFAAWTVVHAMYMWIFGTKFWFLGRKYNFITPGDLIEKYYKSPMLHLIFAIVGIVGLVPYMLIQVTGGAMALESLTNYSIPYWVGVLIMGVFVGIIVSASGGRGAAWSNTFMGVFFGSVLIFIVGFFIFKAGGLGAFKQIAKVAPEVLVNKGEFWTIFETAVGLGVGFFIMPQMWMGFYSMQSPQVIRKTTMITPCWNSWIMALGTLTIGILAHTPGLVPGITPKLADRTIPIFFSSYAPVFGAVVIAAIVAAGISTINSALLGCASLFANDIYIRFFKKDASPAQQTMIGKVMVIFLTIAVILLAFIPAAQGYIVQVASVGYAILMQLVPSVVGAMFWKSGTRKAALTSVISGELVVLIVYLFGSPFPMKAGISGLTIAIISYILVSIVSDDDEETKSVKAMFHHDLNRVFALEDAQIISKK